MFSMGVIRAAPRMALRASSGSASTEALVARRFLSGEGRSEEARREAEHKAALEQEDRIRRENQEMVNSFNQMADWITVEEQKLPTQFDGESAVDFSNAIKTRLKSAESRKRITGKNLHAIFYDSVNKEEIMLKLQSLGIPEAKAQLICKHFKRPDLQEVVYED